MNFKTFDQEMLVKDYWATIEETHNIRGNRERRNVMYRHGFFTACRELTQLSLKSIGNILHKDHATVLHAIRTHESNYQFDNQYRDIYTEIYTCLDDIISQSTEQVYEIIKKRTLKIDPSSFDDRMVQMYKSKFEQQEKHYEEKLKQLNRELNTLKKHNARMQERNDELNAEGLRLKNLL
tara:strand:- start:646 stop:1185 length:540 start_codon:yes stop_codon:yes gene_type:complete